MYNSYEIPKSKVTERLRFENPWWLYGNIPQDIKNMSHRLYFALFYPKVLDISLRRAVVLMGPRRVGKTIMLYHTIQKLIQDNISPQSIIFVSIDNPIYIHKGLEELMHLALETLADASPQGKYFFFDEIQYLSKWENHLKVLVDSYPKTKFVVSGSAAAALKMKSNESGAGRFHDFMLPPLTFQEFLHLQNKKHLIKDIPTIYEDKTIPFYDALDIKQLNDEFIDYLNFGGYPEILFNKSVKQNLSAFIKDDIIDKVLLRDLPGLYGIRNVQDLNRFFAYLAFNTGKEFSPQKIAKDSSLKKEVVKKYLEYLEAAYLIKIVHKIDENARHFKRITGYKVHLTNPSLRTALFSPIKATDDEAGNLVETAIYAQWMHRNKTRLHYAKWKMGRKEGEVDMINLADSNLKPVWALEIKWSNRFVEKPRELKSLIEFCKINHLKSAIVTTIDKTNQTTIEGINLYYYPASLYSYAVGANTLKQK